VDIETKLERLNAVRHRKENRVRLKSDALYTYGRTGKNGERGPTEVEISMDDEDCTG
jgi:hypothetical protein